MRKYKAKAIYRRAISVPVTADEIAHFDERLRGTERTRAQQIRLLLREAGFLPAERAQEDS